MEADGSREPGLNMRRPLREGPPRARCAEGTLGGLIGLALCSCGSTTKLGLLLPLLLLLLLFSRLPQGALLSSSSSSSIGMSLMLWMCEGSTNGRCGFGFGL